MADELKTITRDFSAKITDLKGEPVHIGATVPGVLNAVNTIWETLTDEQKASFNEALEKHAGQPATLATVACTALLPNGFTETDRNISPEEGLKRFRLALKLNAATGPIEIETADRDLIKQVVNKHHTLLVRGRVEQLLETAAE